MGGFTVLVNDNSHYLDESERYKLGDFSDYEQALAACMRLVDAFLDAHCRPGMSTKQLFELYTSFGEDPFVVPAGASAVRKTTAGQPEPTASTTGDASAFSAWDYARRRCQELCG